MTLLLPYRRPLLGQAFCRNELWKRARAVPSLDLRFAENKSLVDATTGAQLVTFTRTSGATFVDSDGLIRTAASGEPRFDHDPTTGESLGLLVEEQRTNSIRNNTMQGAVAGTPGTAPTNWSIDTTGGVFTRTLTGPSTEDGIEYIDVRIQASGAGSFAIRLEGATQIAASVGQVWTNSSYVKLAGGSLTNAACTIRIRENNAGGTILSEYSEAFTPTSSSLRTHRVGITRTLTQATVAFVNPRIEVSFTGAGDLTLRIGLPQLEPGAFATSVIPTTTAAATRSADVASISGSNFSSWYRQDEGTVFADVIRRDNVDATMATFSIGATTADRIQVHSNSASEYRTTYRTGNVEQAALLLSSSSNRPRIASTIKVNDLASVINGSSPSVDTSAALATYDTLHIGARSDASIYWNGTIRRLAYWGQRLPDNVLQAITQ